MTFFTRFIRKTWRSALLIPKAAVITCASLVCMCLAPAAVLGSPGNVWISHAELQSRPMSGAEWTKLLADANSTLSTPSVANQDSNHDVETLAVALAAARTGRTDLRLKATNAILSAIGTESGSRWLAVGRNMGSYVIAADVLGLRADGNPYSAGSRTHTWIASFLTMKLADNNSGVPVGIHAQTWNSGSNANAQMGFVHAAIASYLGNTSELAWSWNGFRRYAGDRTSPITETSNDLSWQYRPDNIVGIQDAGATKNSCRIDGAIGNDMSRGGSYSCTPGYTSYPWVGLEGSVPAALILKRAGYSAFDIQTKALKRAFDYLWFVRGATGNSAWFDGSRANEIVHLANYAYNTSYLMNGPTGSGRTVGYTGFTHPKGATSTTTSPEPTTQKCRTYTADSPAMLASGAALGTACVANATAFPTYVGKMHHGELSLAGTCNSLMPVGKNDPVLALYCLPAPAISVWLYTSTGFVARQLTTSRVYGVSYPYGTSAAWRWMYLPDQGWIAIQQSKTFVRWFTPLSGSSYLF